MYTNVTITTKKYLSINLLTHFIHLTTHILNFGLIYGYNWSNVLASPWLCKIYKNDCHFSIFLVQFCLIIGSILSGVGFYVLGFDFEGLKGLMLYKNYKEYAERVNYFKSYKDLISSITSLLAGIFNLLGVGVFLFFSFFFDKETT